MYLSIVTNIMTEPVSSIVFRPKRSMRNYNTWKSAPSNPLPLGPHTSYHGGDGAGKKHAACDARGQLCNRPLGESVALKDTGRVVDDCESSRISAKGSETRPCSTWDGSLESMPLHCCQNMTNQAVHTRLRLSRDRNNER